MWTFAAVALALAALGFIAYMLMRVEEMLGYLNGHAFRAFTGHSPMAAVFSPLQLHLQLTRATAAQGLFERVYNAFRKLDESSRAEHQKEYRELLGVAYDHEVEAWRYSLMVEANLRVALGQWSRDEGLKSLAEPPKMLARSERIEWGIQHRAAQLRGEALPNDRVPPPSESHVFRYSEVSPLEFDRMVSAARNMYRVPRVG